MILSEKSATFRDHALVAPLTGHGPIPAPGRRRVALVAARHRLIEKETIEAGGLGLSGPTLRLSRSRRHQHAKDKAQDCKVLHRFLHFGMRIRTSEVVDQIGQGFPSAKTTVPTTKTT